MTQYHGRPPRRPPAPPFGRSIGQFLCHQPATPPHDDVDDLSLPDLKQDAALRALLALRALGKPITDDAVATFDAEPRLIALAYRWAYHDAVRKHLGRGTRRLVSTDPHRRQPPGRRPLSLDALLAAAARADAEDIDPDPADLRQLNRLLFVEVDAATELFRLWTDGIDGLTLTQTQRLIGLLILVERLKRGGTNRVPDDIRQRLRLLRRRTGLPLTTKPL